ncbi:MAG: S8 family serine peptidase [Promethearchaeota archaeon]
MGRTHARARIRGGSLAVAVILVCAILAGTPTLHLAPHNPDRANFTSWQSSPSPDVRESPTQEPGSRSDPLAKIHANLRGWLNTGRIPDSLRHRDREVAVLLTALAHTDIDELANHMTIRQVFRYDSGLLIQGFIPTRRDLLILNAMDQVGYILGDEHIPSQTSTPSPLPVTDQYQVQRIIENQKVQASFPEINGTDVVIGICDTGTDFGVTDLATAYHVNSSGFPTSFDPGGTGLAITNYTLPAVGSWLLTEGLDFAMWHGENHTIYMSNSDYGVYTENTTVSGITSQSGLYKVGMHVQQGDITQLFIFLLADETTSAVYDSLYVDWETSWALTADYNSIPTSIVADWDFSNNARHRWGDGTELLADDLDGDGYNDFSMGCLANTFDLFNITSGDLVCGIDAVGRGVALMYDHDGHGTSTAGSAAGRGVQPFDVYGNSTLQTLPGVAPSAKVMALKILTYGDIINAWFWGAGYRPTTYDYHLWSEWDHCGYFSGWDFSNQAHILSNSWGWPDQFFTTPYDYIWGCDWFSYTMDFLSTGGITYVYENATGWTWIDSPGGPDTTHTIAGQIMPAPLFVVSAGNAGPGYGTQGSPNSVTSLIVGASTTSHYAQPIYNNDSSLGHQPYDQIADFSSNGPTPTSLPKPDVVAPGAYAFDITALHFAAGNGNNTWTVFGGTSQAAPIAAGVAALVFQALAYPATPPSGESQGVVKSIIKAGANDLQQPALRQGAGRVNAFRAVCIALGNDTTDGASDYLLSLRSDYTFAHYGDVHPSTWWRSWYMSMFYGDLLGLPYQEDSLYHPGASVGANRAWFDAGFTTHSMMPGQSRWINVTAATPGSLAVDSLDAVWFELLNESTQIFLSTSVDTTYPLFADGHFDTSFMNQFMNDADYAVIHLAYSQGSFETLYDFSGHANSVYLHDWNDTNNNDAIDLQGSGSHGEVRLVMWGASATNVHQIHVGNPGAHWYGNHNATIYYHDVGHELGLWASLQVTVTIRLYKRVDWNWFTFYQYSSLEAPAPPYVYPAAWNVTVTIPATIMPGIYEGFLKATKGTVSRYYPVTVRVDGDVDPGDSLTWGNTDGHPYDNGAITGALNWDGSQASGEWRFYCVNITDDREASTPRFTTSWVMINVTWDDPNTCIDVYSLMTGYGNRAYQGGGVQSVTDYQAGGRWNGTPSWSQQNVLLTDFNDAWAQYPTSSAGLRGYLMICLHVSGYGGTYIPENFTISVSPVNNATQLSGQSLPGPTAQVNASSHGNAAVTEDSVWIGPHVTLNASWEPLSVAGFPTLQIRQTIIELFDPLEQEHYGTITSGFVGGWNPDLNPLEAYDYVDLREGDEVYIELECGTWTAGEGSSLSHQSTDDIDILVWAPGVAHTYANSLTGAQSVSSANPEIGTFIAPVTGNYTIGLDWYSGAQPMGWRCYVHAISLTSTAQGGLWAEIDTQDTGRNGQYDIRVQVITGTSLDEDPLFSTFFIPNVTVVNFFPPTVTVTSPNGGEGFGCDPITITWTASDPNLEETLHFSVEVSNDSGTTWKEIVSSTTQQFAVWDPQHPTSGFPPGISFYVRVNVTDDMFTSSDTSDGLFTVTGVHWISPPTDHVVELGAALHHSVEATSILGILGYSVNDSRFTINTLGEITFVTVLPVGRYPLEIRAYDPYSNYCTATITITVQDTTPPSWVGTPTDQVLDYGTALDYQLQAYDLSGIALWTINDTLHFSISSTGRLTSGDTLNLGSYGLNVTVSDPYGNALSALFTVTVGWGATPPDTLPPGLILLVAGGVCIAIFITVVLILYYWRRRKGPGKAALS